MGDLMKLKVKSVQKETSDAVTIEFKKPFFKKVNYKPGQFLTLVVNINGKEERRAYSLSSVDKELSVTVKKIENGTVSNHIYNEIKTGDTLKVLKPLGNFYHEINKDKKQHLVLIGGGSGITPLMAILKAALQFEEKSKVTLIYTNKSKDSIIFKQQLDDFERLFRNRFQVLHILKDTTGVVNSKTMRLNNETIQILFSELAINATSADTFYYMCGPDTLMQQASDGLKVIGVQKSNIHQESFTAPKSENIPETTEGKTLIAKLPGSDKPIYAHINPKESILSALLRNKQKIKFSCGTGACGTCKCKITKGEVSSTFNLGLSEEEQANGYVLSCVSYPVSEFLELQFD